MRALIQRVSQASVSIDDTVVGKIAEGMTIFLGIGAADKEEDLDKLIKKITQLRIFEDAQGKMNLSILDIKGEILLISQFTLFANCKKGNRPSFIEAAATNIAIELYEKCKIELAKIIEKPVECGVFGADMQVSLTNNGPVTIWLDTDNL